MKVFFMQICQNCTAITIETSPTNTAISGRSRKYWYAAPYPSSFHWWEGIKDLPWLATEQNRQRRDILALFIGSVRTSNMNSNALRRNLYAQCNNEPSCQWHVTAHACNGVSHLSDSVLEMYLHICLPFLFPPPPLYCYLGFFCVIGGQFHFSNVTLPPSTVLSSSSRR